MRPATYPEKPRPGDRVAIVSPSSGLAGSFPMPYELGLRRLREEFGLDPVEYPTTRQLHASPAARAADLLSAFADPTITAVITSIGGDDQITVLSHLDTELLRASPKPFFGFSDNTNMLAYLSNLGIVCYHGGSVMTQFGRPGAMHPQTAESLRAALFDRGTYELRPAVTFTDVERPWQEPATFDSEPAMFAGQGWTWHNAGHVVSDVAWGGNLETLSWLLMADREISPATAYDGGVLFLETSEEMPSGEMVYRILRSMGERSLLRRFPAVLIGRPKAWSFEQPSTNAQRCDYLREQRDAVLRAFTEYAPDAMLVFDVDFGHTDPQLVIPCGGAVTVDGCRRRVLVTY